ncbi:MAG: hypothetical protein KKD29_05230 [Candidatus Omnitrophica bacterium]|nr:hypothetical protein [Candidatus Omnitrophota bacterium]MBU4487978.1 hypothetical protein [Candidatus Omnitrophota bacterium]MCG2704779.1 hypothetical protein [Candidatus Omnitrophota bacterium]
MNLSESEKEFLKKRPSAIKIYGTLTFLIILFGVVYFYLIFNKFIPAYTKLFEKAPQVKEFIETGMISLARMNLIWISILCGVIIGSFFAQLKMDKILRKIVSDK